jgi:Tfp pilus assembly protein PilE
MYKLKVKAFTILEVSITMLITGLLIAITYTSYSIIVKSNLQFTTKNDEMAVLVSLDHLLKRDFDRAESVYKNESGIYLNSGGTAINYEFTPGYIVRHSSRIDTFKVQIQDIITSFENSPLTEIQETEEQNRVDELGFTLTYKGAQIPYIYHKLYSSADLISRNPNAVY